MKSLVNLIFLSVVVVYVVSCKEEYNPQVTESQSSYLVVEGMLINGGPTSIKLSRTRPLNDSKEKPELKAIVSIESETNQKYLFTEQTRGEYTIQLNLNNTQKYRIRIKTVDGKEYLSDFVSVKANPPIDELAWERKDDGVQIYVNTHDPQNSTWYYRWEYEETWQNSPPIYSGFEYFNGAIRTRRVPLPQTCWASGTSHQILLTSTAKLSADVVYKAPINFIPPFSQKLSQKYSILVKQYTLEPGAYTYWQNMQKNTEQLGSIFDPQPSYMYGNIYCTSDSKELVVGYFGACNINEKRIFIQIPNWLLRNNCPTGLIVPALLEGMDHNEVPMEKVIAGSYVPTAWEKFEGYHATPADCVYCSGSSIKPIFWQ